MGAPALTHSDVDERIISHLAFARAVASRAIDRRCRGADPEDLIAWGVVSLVQPTQWDAWPELLRVALDARLHALLALALQRFAVSLRDALGGGPTDAAAPRR